MLLNLNCDTFKLWLCATGPYRPDAKKNSSSRGRNDARDPMDDNTIAGTEAILMGYCFGFRRSVPISVKSSSRRRMGFNWTDKTAWQLGQLKLRPRHLGSKFMSTLTSSALTSESLTLHLGQRPLFMCFLLSHNPQSEYGRSPAGSPILTLFRRS